MTHQLNNSPSLYSITDCFKQILVLVTGTLLFVASVVTGLLTFYDLYHLPTFSSLNMIALFSLSMVSAAIAFIVGSALVRLILFRYTFDDFEQATRS